MNVRCVSDVFTALEAGENVMRYHTEPHVVQQSVASHSWGVATLILLCHPQPSVSLLGYALLHDVQEKKTGDLPYMVKRANPELRKLMARIEQSAAVDLGLPTYDLSEEEKQWIVWADMMEALIHATHLWKNCRYPIAHEISLRAIKALETTHLVDSPTAAELLEQMKELNNEK